MTIWEFQDVVSRRLLTWAGISTALGVVMGVFGKFWRGVGSQFVGWAVVNAAIALGGAYFTERRRHNLETPNAPHTLLREGANLQRLLWINAGLDILYMLGGAWTAARNGHKPRMQGVGVGIILQGLFLFVFDVVHALRTPTWPWDGSDPR